MGIGVCVVIAEEAIHDYGAAQKADELAEFLNMLEDLKPAVIVEIGVFAGGTAHAWGQAAPDATVIGIDLLPGGPWPLYGHGKPRDEHGATVIVGDSHDTDTLWTLNDVLAGRPIDCLFIDGDHSYDGVRQDYEMYRHLVRPGGLIAFHDIVTHQYALGCEVVKLWCEIKDESAVEIVSSEGDHWGGIGVLTVEPDSTGLAFTDDAADCPPMPRNYTAHYTRKVNDDDQEA